ncbi:hypothetical protein WMY93_006697 [Mugilogobius chulae]|uniref:Uncharacterized protein n=1 Tax=Mugilogobius chulae TaxID=88201 RepID=A0AAW0PU84_9GOBI
MTTNAHVSVSSVNQITEETRTEETRTEETRTEETRTEETRTEETRTDETRTEETRTEETSPVNDPEVKFPLLQSLCARRGRGADTRQGGRQRRVRSGRGVRVCVFMEVCGSRGWSSSQRRTVTRAPEPGRAPPREKLHQQLNPTQTHPDSPRPTQTNSD